MRINKAIFHVQVLIVVACAATMTTAQQATGAHTSPHTDKESHPCPLMQGREKAKTGDEADAAHAAHLAAVNARGEKSMGFSQTETTHHFVLSRDGGLIQVEAKDAGDISNRDRIREHLSAIARAFAAGDFATPQTVHGRVPPGVSEMRRLRATLKYEFEELERGGRLRISTDNSEALAAVHQFLRFQIADHQTGDSPEVKD